MRENGLAKDVLLLSGLLVNRRTWQSCISAIDLLGLPDEVLKEVAAVLSQEKVFCLLDDITELGDQGLTFRGQLLRWRSDAPGLQEAIESDVDLLVLRTD